MAKEHVAVDGEYPVDLSLERKTADTYDELQNCCAL